MIATHTYPLLCMTVRPYLYILLLILSFQEFAWAQTPTPTNTYVWFAGRLQDSTFELQLYITQTATDSQLVEGKCFFAQAPKPYPVIGWYEPRTKKWTLTYKHSPDTTALFIFEQYNGKKAKGVHQIGSKSNPASIRLMPAITPKLLDSQIEPQVTNPLTDTSSTSLRRRKPQGNRTTWGYEAIQSASARSFSPYSEAPSDLDFATDNRYGLQSIPFQKYPTLLVYKRRFSLTHPKDYEGSFSLNIKIIYYHRKTWHTLQDTTLFQTNWTDKISTNPYQKLFISSQHIYLSNGLDNFLRWEWKGKTFQVLK
jgi:hypothetical protein